MINLYEFSYRLQNLTGSGILAIGMQILQFIKKQKQGKKPQDFYEDSLSKLGTEQIKKMIERGMRIPVVSI